MVTKAPATDKKPPAAKSKAAATTPTPKAAPKPKAGDLKAKLEAHKKSKANDEKTVLDVGSLIGASEQVSNESTLRARIKELENAIEQKAASDGRPIQVPIQDVIVNPESPNTRKKEDPEFEAWLLESIKEHGIQDPISVHWSEKYTKWIINKGHTRRKMGEKAGLKTVPIIVQDNQTDWNQVIENLIRNNLSARDMVDFIAKKKAEGLKQKDIAKKLSRDAGWVSKHVALENPPTFISHLWEQGYATEFTTLYSLITSYKFDGAATEKEVNKILAVKQVISLEDAEQIKVKIAGKKAPKEKPDLEPGEEDEPPKPPAKNKVHEVDDDREEHDKGEGETKPEPREKEKSLRLKVSVDGTEGFVLLERATAKTNVKIQLSTGTGAVMEVPAEDIKVIGIFLA